MIAMSFARVHTSLAPALAVLDVKVKRRSKMIRKVIKLAFEYLTYDFQMIKENFSIKYMLLLSPAEDVGI